MLSRVPTITGCAGLFLTLLLTVPAEGQDRDPGLGTPPQGKPVRRLIFMAPKAWKELRPGAGVYRTWRLRDPKRPRAAQVELTLFRLPRPKSKEPNEVKGLERHVARWARFWLDREGKPQKAKAASVKKLTLPRIRAHLIQLQGTHVLTRSGERRHLPGWLGFHAILEGPGAVWTVVLTGPDGAIRPWRKGFVAFVQATRIGRAPLRRPRPKSGR